MKNIFLFLLLVTTISTRAGECVPAREFVPFPGRPGIFHRVSPDGNYVMQSLSAEGFGDVSIVDFSKRDTKTGARIVTIHKTPMRNETYPVEGSWRYIASPGTISHPMEYYRFSDLLRDKENTNYFFDDNFWEFYHSCGELAESTATMQKFRVMSWTHLIYKDFEVNLNSDGSIASEIKKSDTKWMCENIASEEGFELVQPLLSKDGQEVAGIPQNNNNPTMRVYKIFPNGDCEKVLDLGFQTSKVGFSHPQKGSKGMLAFTDQSGVFVYDRDRDITIPVSDAKTESRGSYPGFSKDGRVIYLTSKNDQMGYSIVDPYQAYPNKTKACITVKERKQVEEEFRKISGL